MSSWATSWFNSPYYHLLYQHRDEREARHFMTNLLRYINLPEQSHILDLACGKGRHAVYLAEQNYRVTGIDLASDSIAWARHTVRKGLNFEVHDMRQPFPVRDLDAVFNLFTSFGYFETEEEHQQTLKNVSDSLKLGGRVVIDFLNAEKVIQNLVAEDTKNVNGIVFHQRRYVRNGYITKEIQFDDEGQRHSYQEKVRAFSLHCFRALLKPLALQIDTCFGDYDLNPFDEKESSRLIILATKSRF